MDILKYRKTSFATIVTVGAMGLVGCGTPPNYAGRGNSFHIEAVVKEIKPKDRKFKIFARPLRILLAEGEAVDFFSDKDDYEVWGRQNVEGDDGWFGECEEEHDVGYVVNEGGAQINVADLEPGTELDIEGRVRDSSDFTGKFCDTEERAVFDKVKVTHVPFSKEGSLE